MKQILFIAIALVLVFITRFWRLESIPLHLTQDEIAVGYGAFSIEQTGADEWNQSWPLQFRSVGDFKQPLLFYLTAISVGLLGLTELAVRLPVALFSSLSLLVVYFWIKDWLKPKYKSWAIIGVFLWLLSPWHIVLSRTSLEAVLGLFFVLVNLYAWTRFIRHPAWGWVWLALAAAAGAIVSYHSHKVFVPLFNLGMLLIFRQQILAFFALPAGRVKLGLTVAVGLVLAGWLYLSFYTGTSMVRGQMTFLRNDFDYARALVPLIEGIRGEELAKLWFLLELWFKRLLEYFDLSYWWFEGLGLTLPDFPSAGLIYPGEVILMLLGGILLLRPEKLHSIFEAKYHPEKIIPLIFLLGLLPATLANNSKHLLRSLNALPAVYLLIFLGLIWLWTWAKTKRRLSIVGGVLVVTYFIGLARFMDFYLVHYPVQLSEYRQYPWAQAAKTAIKLAPGYDEVIVDSRFGTQGPYAVGVPHYYFLFYSQFDPAIYQRRGTEVVDFANFKFRYINWQIEDHQGKLYVASPWSFLLNEIPQKNILWQAPFKNGVPGLLIVDGNFPQR